VAALGEFFTHLEGGHLDSPGRLKPLDGHQDLHRHDIITRLSNREKANRKRMVELGTVYNAAPHSTSAPQPDICLNVHDRTSLSRRALKLIDAATLRRLWPMQTE
jgi:hypothetical protein